MSTLSAKRTASATPGTGYHEPPSASPFLFRALLRPVHDPVPSRRLHAIASLVLIAIYAGALATGLWYFTFQSTIMITEIVSEDGGNCQPLSADTGTDGWYQPVKGILAKAPTTLNENRMADRMDYWTIALEIMEAVLFEDGMTHSKIVRDFMRDHVATLQHAMTKGNLTRGCRLFNNSVSNTLQTYDIGPFLDPDAAAAAGLGRFQNWIMLVSYRSRLNSQGDFPADLWSLLSQCCNLVPRPGPPTSTTECFGTVSEALFSEFFLSSLAGMAKFVRSTNGPYVCVRQLHKSIYEAIALSFSIVFSIDVFLVMLVRFIHLRLQSRLARAKHEPSTMATDQVPSGSVTEQAQVGDNSVDHLELQKVNVTTSDDKLS